MNAIQIPFLVEGILILAASIFGILLGKSGKPHGKVKVVFHIFFFAWLTTGYGFIATTLFDPIGFTLIWIPVILMGLAILTQVLFGILMLDSKQIRQSFRLIHRISAITLFVADISAFIIAGIHFGGPV